jgi:hypothetical protein
LRWFLLEMGHRMGHSRQAQGTAPAEDSGYRLSGPDRDFASLPRVNAETNSG